MTDKNIEVLRKLAEAGVLIVSILALFAQSEKKS